MTQGDCNARRGSSSSTGAGPLLAVVRTVPATVVEILSCRRVAADGDEGEKDSRRLGPVVVGKMRGIAARGVSWKYGCRHFGAESCGARQSGQERGLERGNSNVVLVPAQWSGVDKTGSRAPDRTE